MSRTRMSAVILVAVYAVLNVGATTYYVNASRPDDSGAGTSWGTAKKTIQAAVDSCADDDTVWVTNGTYYVATQVSLMNGVTVASVNGAEVTIIDGGTTTRCVYLSHTNAVIRGFTVRNGRTALDGAGIYVDNYGSVWNCIIQNNTSTSKWGGGVYLLKGGVYNSLVQENSAVTGGGVSCGWSGGVVRNCTITGNYASSDGGGVRLHHGGSIQNCIIYFNTAPVGPNFNTFDVSPSFSYCCSTPTPSGTGNTESDPLFANAAAGDYRLTSGSPCINSGLSETWMESATDLDGKARLVGIVDMGAYELASGGFSLSAVGMEPNGAFRLTIRTVGGQANYQVEATTNLLCSDWDWESVSSPFLASAGLVVFVDTNAPLFYPQRFYRVRQIPPVDTNAPGNVTSLMATPGNAQVVLSWSNPADADFAGVIILRKTGSYPTSPTDGTIVQNGTGTSKTDTSLVNGTAYYYKAFSYDGVPNYASGVTATATPQAPDTTPPSNVTSFTATPGNAQVVLSWSNPADADFAGVKILRKIGGYPTSTADGTVVHSGTGTSRTDTGLVNGTAYYYKAFSFDGVPNYASGVTALATPFVSIQGARVSVTSPVELTVGPIGAVWQDIPTEIAGSTIYALPYNLGEAGGRVQFEVTRSGRLYLALNYSYQGSAGAWTSERWLKADFEAAGWTFIPSTMYRPNNIPERVFDVCYKNVVQGESYSLRCNKYEPPYPIELPDGVLDTTPPGNVTSFTATPGNGQVSLSWVNPADADFAGVKILRKTGSYPTSQTDGTIVHNGTGTSKADTGLVNGTAYYYKVFSYDGVPNYASGVTALATPQAFADTTPPGNVTSFTATPGNGQVSLSWANPTASDFAGVKILRKTGGYPTSTTDGTMVHNGIGTSKTDTGLSNGTAYYYKAFSYDGVPNYASGITALATPQAPDTTPPGNVTSFSATPGNGQVSLSWVNPTASDFAGVKILRKTGSYPTSTTDGTIVHNGTGTSRTDTGLSNGTTYYYKAFSYDGVPNYANGVTALATPQAPDTTPPGNVTSFTATPGNGQVSLSWAKPVDADFAGVKIMRTTGFPPDNPNDGTVVYNGTSTSRTDTGLSNGTTYYYKAFSYDEVPNYASGVAKAAMPTSGGVDTTPPGNVTLLRALPRDGAVILLFVIPFDEDLTGIMIRRKVGGYPTSPTDGTSVTLSAGQDEGLSNGTTYYYKVYTYDEVPNYSSGASITATPTSVPDTTPPANITSFTATPGPGSGMITLNWQWPTDPGFVGITVKRKTGGYPTDWGDGDLVGGAGVNPYDYSGRPPLVDGSLTGGNKYYYRAFSHDFSGNFSSGASATATAP